MSVQAGDFLAVYENSAQLKIIDVPVASQENYFNVQADSNWPARATNGFTITTADGSLAAGHAIKAHVVRPIGFKFQHTYTDWAAVVHNITIETGNNISWFETVVSIDILVTVENVTLVSNVTEGKQNNFYISYLIFNNVALEPNLVINPYFNVCDSFGFFLLAIGQVFLC